ncbi:MAG: hypothetical protein QNJ00_11155 [Woeseiaceae bacterium]|nr:hypothetical protein [Woeseiaceae bacterium]
MNRQIIALSVVLLAGCAAPQPTPNAGIESPATSAETSIASAESATAESGLSGDIEFADPLAPTPTAVVHPTMPDSQVICKMERRTGTNRKVKVCRRQPTAQEAADTRQTFESLRRSQQQPY